MSDKNWTVNGCGFYVEKITKEILNNFVQNHSSAFGAYKSENPMKPWKEFSEDISSDMDDLYDTIAFKYTDRETIAEIIAFIMSEETGITFEAPGITPDEGLDAVILRPVYPWQYSDREKALTSEELDVICKKYADELGVRYPGGVELDYWC